MSQYKLPIVQDGTVGILLEDGAQKTIGVTRAHLEEDAGKSFHEGFGNSSGIDLNRAGTPLLEIVSEPDLRLGPRGGRLPEESPHAGALSQICDGNMQEGSFRCDANVSVRPRVVTNWHALRTQEPELIPFHRKGDQLRGCAAGRADRGRRPGCTGNTAVRAGPRDETRPMRSKEEANDYRYFPDPDLLPVAIDGAY